jgi:hypothetical protein
VLLANICDVWWNDAHFPWRNIANMGTSHHNNFPFPLTHNHLLSVMFQPPKRVLAICLKIMQVATACLLKIS